MFNAEFVANVIMHIGFIATLLGIVFFTYGNYIEEVVTTSQVETLTDQYFTLFNLLITPAQKALLKTAFLTVQKPDMSVADNEAAVSNNSIRNEAIIVLGSLLIICTFTSYLMSKYFKFSFGELLKENLIIVFFVLCTELIFATFIAKNYLAADPNYVKLVIINALINYVNN